MTSRLTTGSSFVDSVGANTATPGLTQNELDRAYDQDHWVANAAEIAAAHG